MYTWSEQNVLILPWLTCASEAQASAPTCDPRTPQTASARHLHSPHSVSASSFAEENKRGVKCAAKWGLRAHWHLWFGVSLPSSGFSPSLTLWSQRPPSSGLGFPAILCPCQRVWGGSRAGPWVGSSARRLCLSASGTGTHQRQNQQELPMKASKKSRESRKGLWK